MIARFSPQRLARSRLAPREKFPWGTIVCVVLLQGACPQLGAQEIAGLGGITGSANLRESSYTWELDYRQYIDPELAVSFDWINEGHLPGRSPDGFAAEGWYNLPLAGDRLSLSIGAGPFFYCDTNLLTGKTIDAHGFAPIFSGSLTGYISKKWFWRFTYNRVNPSRNDIKVNTAAVGVGYWLGSGGGPDGYWAQGRPSEREPFSPENSLTYYEGWRVSNTRISKQTLAEGLEYRRSLLRHVEASASFMYEGAPGDVQRTGVIPELWAVDQFPDCYNVTVGIGMGAYFYLYRKGEPSSPGAAGGMASPMIAYRIGDGPWSVRMVWNRIITNYNRDSDVWMLGLGRSWR
jgi:hypothetical protein